MKKKVYPGPALSKRPKTTYKPWLNRKDCSGPAAYIALRNVSREERTKKQS